MILGLTIVLFLVIIVVVSILFVLSTSKWGYDTGEGYTGPAYTITKKATLQEIVDQEVNNRLYNIIHKDLKESFVRRVVPDDQILFALSKLTKDNLEFAEIMDIFNKERRKYEDMLRWEEERNKKDMYP